MLNPKAAETKLDSEAPTPTRTSVDSTTGPASAKKSPEKVNSMDLDVALKSYISSACAAFNCDPASAPSPA